MFKISSWNINSVRLRKDLVCSYLKEENPDILCLQETKTEDQYFPHQPFEDLGYSHRVISGQKSYNGVAILSKIPIKDSNIEMITPQDGARHISVTLFDEIRLRNFYIPAGGDIADESENQKFKHKMNFLRELRNYYSKTPSNNEIILGDFNIAPHENDVWSHKQLLKVVSHTQQEVDMLNGLKINSGFHDIMRENVDKDTKLYSWWSYRARDWKKSNRGRRLDHIWCSDNLKKSIKDFDILSDYRGFTSPSDHVPISVNFDF